MVYGQEKEKSKLKVLALWLILAGVGGGLIIFFSAGPISTAIQNFGADNTPRGTAKITIFYDANQDGQQDPLDKQEHPMGQIDVSLKSDFYQAKQTSSEQGQALFENVPLGDYEILLDFKDTQLSGEGYSITIDSTSETNKKVGVFASDNNISQILGHVFTDTNDNGKLDNTDEPAASILISLSQRGQDVLQVATNQQGYFEIPARRIGDYSLKIIQQEGVSNTLEHFVKVRSNLDPHRVEFLLPPSS